MSMTQVTVDRRFLETLTPVICCPDGWGPCIENEFCSSDPSEWTLTGDDKIIIGATQAGGRTPDARLFCNVYDAWLNKFLKENPSTDPAPAVFPDDDGPALNRRSQSFSELSDFCENYRERAATATDAAQAGENQQAAAPAITPPNPPPAPNGSESDTALDIIGGVAIALGVIAAVMYVRSKFNVPFGDSFRALPTLLNLRRMFGSSGEEDELDADPNRVFIQFKTLIMNKPTSREGKLFNTLDRDESLFFVLSATSTWVSLPNFAKNFHATLSPAHTGALPENFVITYAKRHLTRRHFGDIRRDARLWSQKLTEKIVANLMPNVGKVRQQIIALGHAAEDGTEIQQYLALIIIEAWGLLNINERSSYVSVGQQPKGGELPRKFVADAAKNVDLSNIRILAWIHSAIADRVPSVAQLGFSRAKALVQRAIGLWSQIPNHVKGAFGKIGFVPNPPKAFLDFMKPYLEARIESLMEEPVKTAATTEDDDDLSNGAVPQRNMFFQGIANMWRAARNKLSSSRPQMVFLEPAAETTVAQQEPALPSGKELIEKGLAEIESIRNSKPPQELKDDWARIPDDLKAAFLAEDDTRQTAVIALGISTTFIHFWAYFRTIWDYSENAIEENGGPEEPPASQINFAPSEEIPFSSGNSSGQNSGTVQRSMSPVGALISGFNILTGRASPLQVAVPGRLRAAVAFR